jgi:hypothetical protein
LGIWWTIEKWADQTWEVMEVSSFAVELSGGRSLEVSAWGPVQGTPLVFHHGTPSERTQYPPFAQAAAARGLRHQLLTADTGHLLAPWVRRLGTAAGPGDRRLRG